MYSYYDKLTKILETCIDIEVEMGNGAVYENVPQQEKEDETTKSFLPQKLHETAQQYSGL